MRVAKTIKACLIGAWLICGLFYLTTSSFSKTGEGDDAKKPPAATNYKAEDYVGSETCKACHADQFANFSKTPHAKLANAPGWKDRVQGCESCHGPGKLHVDGGGDKTRIRTFKNESPKQISETCLQCHAGKEEHNNFKRGEHWRNDVGCATCHTPHGEFALNPQPAPPSTEKYLAGIPSEQGRPINHAMLKQREPQLCLQCHSEMKAQFSMPFHHRVPEGAMNCSDCHNPHGGFELKQARLAVGADAACIKCHADKQGPFVFEHAPSKAEGCAICHTPHGASNPKLLKRTEVRQLCLECHSNTGAIGAPNTPSFHNQATLRFQNCTTCHVRIHGSNVNKFFFR